MFGKSVLYPFALEEIEDAFRHRLVKGLTNGAIPVGAVFASRQVYDGLMTGPESQIEVFQGYTYSGHPAASGAGIATMEIYTEGGLLTRAAGFLLRR